MVGLGYHFFKHFLFLLCIRFLCKECGFGSEGSEPFRCFPCRSLEIYGSDCMFFATWRKASGKTDGVFSPVNIGIMFVEPVVAKEDVHLGKIHDD